MKSILIVITVALLWSCSDYWDKHYNTVPETTDQDIWEVLQNDKDISLFVEALKGFPGPYAAYVYKTISNPGLLKLMENLEDREATFRSVIAYYEGRGEPVCFEGEASGKIAPGEIWGKLNTGFGFDPIFVPLRSKKTFEEMTFEEKNGFSHRANAVRKFAEWYKKKTVVI